MKKNYILAAHIGLTFKCNMRCKHCFVIKYKDRMRLSDWKNIISELVKKNIFFIYYTYGEPLLSKHFFEIATIIHSADIYQILMSNGYFVTVDIAKKIKLSGVNQVMISIDSHIEEKHDENRRTIGAWQHALAAIEILRNSGIKVGIAFTITNENMTSIPHIINMGELLGVNKISFLRLRKNGKLGDMNDMVDYFTKMEQLIKYEHKSIEIIFHDFTLIPIIELTCPRFMYHGEL